jgi:hypothetical protein
VEKLEAVKRRDRTPMELRDPFEKALTMTDVRSLFNSCGLNYEQIIPLNVRNRIIKETLAGKKIELKALKELVNDFLTKNPKRKAISMKKLSKPHLDSTIQGKTDEDLRLPDI